jgi:hypothetical protein
MAHEQLRTADDTPRLYRDRFAPDETPDADEPEGEEVKPASPSNRLTVQPNTTK